MFLFLYLCFNYLINFIELCLVFSKFFEWSSSVVELVTNFIFKTHMPLLCPICLTSQMCVARNTEIVNREQSTIFTPRSTSCLPTWKTHNYRWTEKDEARSLFSLHTTKTVLKTFIDSRDTKRCFSFATSKNFSELLSRELDREKKSS